ncbi:thioredoxin domain-containing protein [Halothiobacillus diazotrophicus]|nr:hypothetical protein [Halothiobacillus diazotrophicus]
MSTIIFYEKPGCQNQAGQKQALRAAGFDLDVRNLLTTSWRAETLRPFFGDRPVADWFNRAAPRVKSGEVVPEEMAPEEALAAMMADPLLIRRPLMQIGQLRVCGYDEISKRILWISTGQGDYAIGNPDQFQTCTQTLPCPNPDQVTQLHDRAHSSSSPSGSCASGGNAHHEESRHAS